MVYTGQRYHVVLTAKPNAESEGDNYWIRTIPADGCGLENFVFDGTRLLNNTGILRYDSKNNEDPKTKPASDLRLKCADEGPTFLKPIVPWNIPKPPLNNSK